MPEIQVFVKWIDNKTKTVDVDSDATVAELKAGLKQKLDNPPEEVRLIFAGKVLDNDATLKECGIKSESSLIGTPVIKPKVSPCFPVLQEELGAVFKDFGDNQFIFISIASYDPGRGLASVKHQQCPDALVRFCSKEGWDLTIFLIDPCFTPEQTDPQIYDVKSQGWVGKPVLTMCEDNVRVYKNQYATHIEPDSSKVARNDFRIVTFACGVPEYVFPGCPGGIVDRRKVAKIPLADAFEKKIKEGKLKDCCVVSGNFHGDPPHKSQFITIGNQLAVVKSGFIWNP